MITRIVLIAAGLLPLLSGCSSNEVPKQPWTNHETALAVMSRRAEALQTLSARCLLTLENSQGTVRFDSGLAMKRGGYVRMRAWKFNQAVFDLTVTPEGMFVIAPEDPADPGKALRARMSAVRIARAFRIFGGDLFSSDNVVVMDQRGPTFTFREAAGEDTTILCTVDRETLTAQKYELVDASGMTRFTLKLERYRRFGEAVFPMRIIGESGSGMFTAELEEVEVNQPLAPNSFIPPPRAEKLQ